jgi:hypothetical protein
MLTFPYPGPANDSPADKKVTEPDLTTLNCVNFNHAISQNATLS